jgi:hypothetical protein
MTLVISLSDSLTLIFTLYEIVLIGIFAIMSALAQKIDQLPEPLQRKGEDFIDFISRRYWPQQQSLSLSWAGGISEYREQFTSLALQKKSLNWWNG